MNDGSIWVIDDDRDDHELISEIMVELGILNEVVFFHTAKEFLERIEREDEAPFIIICDVNLPGIDGFGLRETMLKKANKKLHGVPFIFWSTYASEEQIQRAFRLSVHGFFIKEGEYNQWKETFTAIIRYWHLSKMPSKNDEYDKPMPVD